MNGQGRVIAWPASHSANQAKNGAGARRRFAAPLGLAVVVGLGAVAAPAGAVTPADPAGRATPEQTAADGYVYGYGPVVAARTRAAFVCHTPVNTLVNARNLSTPLTRSVVAPNVDTLYSLAWLDLRDGPVTLSVPATDDRYVVFQFLDMYTNTFADIGTRLNGSAPGTYTVVPPDWAGSPPVGTTVVQAPTWDVWMLGRTLVRGQDDLPAARAVQSQYGLTAAGTGPIGPVPPVLPAADCTDPPDPQTPADNGPVFFDELAAVLAADPPPAADQPALDGLATLGVVPGAAPSTGDPAAVAALTAGVTIGEAQVQAAVDTVLEPSGTWDASFSGGTYGVEYLTRAAVAAVVLGANVPAESLYYWADEDSTGAELTGQRSYQLHFEPGALPPVDGAGFWSLTMYDEDMFLVPNPLRRYALGDRDDLTYNGDGSVDILVSAARPTGPVSNWLPAPDGPFNLMIRAYLPEEAALTNTWNPPPVVPTS